MRRLFFPLAMLILLVAAVLRLHQLNTYPPGPHYDEAANILITRSILNGANLFPIADSYQGRESLYYYLSAPLFYFVTDNAFTLRISSAFINLVTIAASMALGRSMFGGNRGVVIGLAAGVLMALSFHQILMARQAYRAVTLPMMQALALLFLWRGLNTRPASAWYWLVLGGVFAGGVLYTYMASRLFPLWLGLAALLLLLLDRAHFRRRVGQCVLCFGLLIVTALPMGIYALERPDVFLQRLGEVSEGEITVTLTESIRRHAEMFFIQGDTSTLRYNIPGRPYFTLPEGLLLLIGSGVALWRLARSSSKPTERAAYGLLLLAPLMVMPSVISLAGFPPSHMRSLGMVPLIFILVAVGFEAVYSAIRSRIKALQPPATFAALVIVVLLVGGMLISRLYSDWARRADLFYQTDADLALAARWLAANVDDETPVYVASYHREHPTIIAGWGKPVTWLGTDSLILPPPGRDGVVIFAHDTPPLEDWLPILNPGRMDNMPPGPDGEPAFHAFRLNPNVALEGLISPPQDVRNPHLSLVGYKSSPIDSGTTSEITLAWRIEQTPPYYRLRPILYLRDTNGATISTSDVFLLGTDSWRPGEIVLQRMRVDVPHGTPPGQYSLFVTWVDRDSETYLSYLAQDSAHAGITAQVGNMDVIRPERFAAPEMLAIMRRYEADIAPGIRLLGWNPPTIPPGGLRPGEILRPVLFWQALPADSPRGEVQMRALLRAEDDTIIWEGEPVYSTVEWVNGELVTERLHWPIPHDQPAATYILLLEAAGQEFTLAELQIAGLARIFEPPQVETRLDARLGDSLLIYGYTLDFEDGVRLDLVWAAEGSITEDYTVFVHLVDENGIVVAQRDVMPLNNEYPTSLWVAGEYVLDRYHFDQISGATYTLRIGLYMQTSGERLPVLSAEGETVGDHIDIRHSEGVLLKNVEF
jgi:4-amino-4-deoxy-L-arabinose transferase-like glycosyltransferase